MSPTTMVPGSSTTNNAGSKSLEDLVKILGRKARARLDEERSKRPEIVRLDGVLLPQSGTTTAAQSHNAESLPVSEPGKLLTENRWPARSPLASQKRKRRRSSTGRHAAIHDKDVDRWMPNINNLPLCGNDIRSRLIQLHGLPFGSTTTDVRRFFTGLAPQRVLLLPSYSAGYIPELDASESLPRKKKGIHVDRYGSDFRVLVQFESAPTAALAADRSGEVMPLEYGENGHGAATRGNGNDAGPVSATGAAVAVSQIPKPISSYLLKHMVIDATPSTPLHLTLEQVEGKLDPLINSILWESAKHVLQLRPDQSSSKHRKRRGVEIFKFVNEPTNHKTYNQLVEHRKSLQRIHEKLRYQLPFPSAELLDPALAADPVVRLTAGADACILTEMQRLDEQLLRTRRWRLGLGKCLSATPSAP